jgi:hypothetical protein
MDNTIQAPIIVASCRPERDGRGRFLPGNTVGSPGGSISILAIQQTLRKQFLLKATPEHIDKLYDGLYDLALNCPDWKTRLAATDMLLVRLIGKVKEEIEMTVNDTSENRQRANEILMLWKERCTAN